MYFINITLTFVVNGFPYQYYGFAVDKKTSNELSCKYDNLMFMNRL